MRPGLRKGVYGIEAGEQSTANGANDTWYGMTYKEDVAAVKASFERMLDNGFYKKDFYSWL